MAKQKSEEQEEMESKAVPAYTPPKKKNGKPAPSVAGRKVLRSFTETLPVELTETERLKAGADLAGLFEEQEKHALHASQVKADLKAREKSLVSSIKSKSLQLTQRVKSAEVQVQIEADFDEGVARYIRLDNGEEYMSRPLEASERQDSIVFDGSAENGPPSGMHELPEGVTPLKEDD